MRWKKRSKVHGSERKPAGNRAGAARLLAVALLAACGALAAVGVPAGSPDAGSNASPLLDREIQVQVARLLSERLPALHLKAPSPDDDPGGTALDGFFDQLDRNRYFFLASDIAEFRDDSPTLHDLLQRGDLSLAFRVFERFKERAADRFAFAEAVLENGPPESESDEFSWRRRDAPWPQDRDTWDSLWRMRLRNEWLARVVAVQIAEDERERVSGEGDDPGDDGNGDLRSIDPEDEDLADLHLGPEAFVLNRHRQFLLVLEDSDDLWIVERFFNAFAHALDPHSEYLSPSRSEDFDINMRLSLFGIGALLSTEDGAARIVRVLPGGPAERDGRLGPGDRIIAVAQGDEEPVNVLHWPLYRVVRLIRGERGTRVVLTVWPASDISGATERRIDLVRDEVRLEERAARAVTHSLDGPDGAARLLGVVTLPDFYADFRGDSEDGEARRSARDVHRLIEDLKAEGVEGIVLDLRNNGGGSLMDAIEIAGLFIESGPVVQVRDRRGIHVLNDPSVERVYEGPLVVLVNRMSASASEIVAAALQDYRRALVVGDSKTHGKGTVQSLMPLDRRRPDLGSIKVTTAAFYRIAGGSTQVRGVAPDVVVPSPYDAMEIGEEFLPNALPWTSVPAAFYATMEGDVPPLELVREFSLSRRSEDPRHREREALIEELARRQRAERISLERDVRLDEARRERALDLWQQRATPPGREDDDAEPDLVLEEALRVLADTVAWQKAAREAANPSGRLRAGTVWP